MVIVGVPQQLKASIVDVYLQSEYDGGGGSKRRRKEVCEWMSARAHGGNLGSSARER